MNGAIWYAMALEFREVTGDNFFEFIELEVKPDQKNNFFFKSTKPNLMSLAQLHIYKGSRILAIYDGEALVGGMLYSPGEGGKDAWLTRFMIDGRYQGKGYGRKAMLMLLERVKAENPKAARLGLSYEPHNKKAEKLYRDLGFGPSGELIEGQVVVWKTL